MNFNREEWLEIEIGGTKMLVENREKWNEKHKKCNKTKQIRTNIKVKRNSEQFSEIDIKELMGVSRPTYKRYKGSFRQK